MYFFDMDGGVCVYRRCCAFVLTATVISDLIVFVWFFATAVPMDLKIASVEGFLFKYSVGVSLIFYGIWGLVYGNPYERLSESHSRRMDPSDSK